MSSALLGQVFNRALSKHIAVYLAESGPGYKRLTGAIATDLKEKAFATVQERFENGSLFKEEDMKRIHQLTIKSMFHESAEHREPHCTVDAEDDSGTKVKGGHVTEDPSKQTQAN